jgi:hypothetical protein
MKWIAAIAIAVGCGHEPTAPVLPRASSLRLTEGSARPSGGSVAISEPSVRGVVPDSTGDAAALELVYLGPTVETAALASGAERSQLGLKLRAQDSCNVVYVMWRIEPVSEIVVQLKRNPERTTHAACGNAGYDRIRAGHRSPPPALVAGTAHVLSAAIDGDDLSVWADEVLVWRGALPPEARALRGPAGFRTDNVRAELVLHARFL